MHFRPFDLVSNPRTGRTLLLLAMAGGLLALDSVAAAQWRGIDVPEYPGASNPHVETDADEYEARFHSDDDPKAVFDFYRDALERQGFKVIGNKDAGRGYRADLVRDAGRPANTLELEVKPKHGRYKVEIEFDE